MQTRLAVSSLRHWGSLGPGENRDVLTGKSPTLLLLPACTLTYICWNRVRKPRVRATETHYPEEFSVRPRRGHLYLRFHRLPIEPTRRSFAPMTFPRRMCIFGAKFDAFAIALCASRNCPKQPLLVWPLLVKFSIEPPITGLITRIHISQAHHKLVNNYLVNSERNVTLFLAELFHFIPESSAKNKIAFLGNEISHLQTRQSSLSSSGNP